MKKQFELMSWCLMLLMLWATSCKTEKLADPKPAASLKTEGVTGTFTETPRKALDFVNSIGVCIHLTYAPYHDHFYDIVMPKLKLLGIKHVREGVPYRWLLPAADTAIVKNRLIQLHDSLGITVNYVIASKKIVDTLSLRDSANYLSVFRTTPQLLPTIESLEGFNEPDLTIYSWYPANYDTLTYKIQKGLYTRAHAMPELAGKPIICTSITSYWSSPSRPNKIAAITPSLSSYFDYANFHVYDSGNQNWKMFPGTYYDLTQHFFPPVQMGKPYAVTETGYENAHDWNLPSSSTYNPSTYHYLSELSSGKYYSVLFMEQLKRGAKWVYSYEFIDQKTSDQTYSENNFGLIHTDGTVKPAFTAVKNTIDLLSDANTAFTPTPLTYTLSGDTTNIRTYLFQKTDGRYYLAIWQGQPAGVNYDFTNFLDSSPDVQNVTVAFTQSFSSVKTYKPMESTNVISTATGVSSVALPAPDQLMLVELKP